VLFACGQNSIRSPMASALMRHFHGHRTYAISAGVRVGRTSPFAIEVMREIGLDISAHAPRSLAGLHDTNFDLVVTLAPEAHHRALEMTRTMAVDVEYWPTEDPSLITGNRDQVLGAYRRVRDGLSRRILTRFATTSPANP
jgi:protein-tyrosine-phosphatase